MCRLLAHASPAPTTTQDVLGAAQRRVFQDMARLHRDGWGTAWVAGTGTDTGVRADRAAGPGFGTSRSDRSGLEDAELTAALADDAATARLVHLRLATDGMACTPLNTHPFRAEDLAFAHNGSLVPPGVIERFIDDDLRDALEGDTDSERYFAAIRTALRTGMPVRAAVASTVAALRGEFPDSSLNAILLSPTHLVAVHASERAPAPTHEFAVRGVLDLLPREHDESYYLMRHARLEDGTVVFASSGLDIADWQPLPAESVAVVDLATLAMEIIPIAAVDARAAA